MIYHASGTFPISHSRIPVENCGRIFAQLPETILRWGDMPLGPSIMTGLIVFAVRLGIAGITRIAFALAVTATKSYVRSSP